MELDRHTMRMLRVALRGEGRSKGLIALSDTLGRTTWAKVGDTESRLFGEEAEGAWRSFYELLDRNLIVQIMVDGGPAGYMVTPLGCDVAAAAEGVEE